MMNFLDRAAVGYQVVLTKIDQVHESDRETRHQQIKQVLSRHPAARGEIIMTSSENKAGIDALRAFIVAEMAR
jgi:GTP-binding protein